MASRHDWHWTFGDRCHISFPNGGDPFVDQDHVFKTDEGCATISDSSGNLLFYTDGVSLYNAADIQVTAADLGGGSSASHSAIIVPPAGGGTHYHIFTMRAWDVGPVGPLSHSSVHVGGGGAVALTSGPTKLTTLGPPLSSERLASVPHRDCSKYWVIAMDGGTPEGPIEIEGGGVGPLTPDLGKVGKVPSRGLVPPEPRPGNLYAILVDSDLAPTTQTVTPYPYRIAAAYCCKMSPDGSMLAITSDHTVDLLRFDRATGVFSGHAQLTGFSGDDRSYGVEFSPNGNYLYVSVLLTGKIYRYDVTVPGGAAIGALAFVGETTELFHSKYRIGALQLGPNGKIYGIKVKQPTLLEIGDPDNSAPGSVDFLVDALDSSGKKLELHGEGILGLPTFARIPPECDDRCDVIADRVNKELARQAEGLNNQMAPCRHEDDPTGGNPHEPGGAYGSQTPHGPPTCTRLDIPEIRPWTAIRWGDSKCDCIEGDDTEIMYLTVCNPYSNITFSNLTVHQLEVLDGQGKPVPTLPDGSPSIQLVPIGPYCFDDIAPCTCVTRQFIVRLRGAPGGRYDIKLRGICFDVCIHGDAEACFTFQVCKD